MVLEKCKVKYVNVVLLFVHPEAASRRIVTEKQLYIKMCRNFGVVPVSYYVRNMTEPELRMRYHGLGPSGTKALSVPLQVSQVKTFSVMSSV